MKSVFSWARASRMAPCVGASSAWSWRRAVGAMALLLLMAAPEAHAFGNPWFRDERVGAGSSGCQQLWIGSSPTDAESQMEQCRIDDLNAKSSPGTVYSFTPMACSVQYATTWTHSGVMACPNQETVCFGDGTCKPNGTWGWEVQQCPDGDLFIPASGIGTDINYCVHVSDGYRYCPTCDQPGYGNPIYPLNGAKVQSENLGIELAGHPLLVTYDTSQALPMSNGTINLTVPPPPSFGPFWASSMHRRVVLQPGARAPISAYASTIVTRGSRPSTFSIDGPNTCANGGNGTGGSSGTYTPTTDHGLQFKVADRYDAQTTSQLIDGPGLVEESYDGSGLLTQAANAAGGWVSYAYSTAPIAGVAPAAGLLLTATDHAGRIVSFTYEQPDVEFAPRINTITAPDGAITHFAYDAKDNLTTITWPDTGVRTFRYERADLPWAMTGITDESSKSYSAYDYDSAGLATSTHLATNVDSFIATYGNGPKWEVSETTMPDGTICRDHHMLPPSATIVTDAASTATSLGAISTNGMTKMSSQIVSLGNGATATLTQTFDGNGNVRGRTDLDGNQTCYSHDLGRDLETVRVEGRAGGSQCPTDLGAAYTIIAPGAPGYDPTHPQRKTTTEWLANWALPTRIAEPNKITTWVYNTVANSCAPSAPLLPDGSAIAVVCSRTEHATSDATGQLGTNATPTGAPRTWTYTYDQFGHVMTEVAPKQVSTDPDSKYTTTYTYYTDPSFPDGVSGHSVGDLKSVKNPLNQVTRYTSYDKAGRLLSSTAANGTVTTRSYWPRGWLHTLTVTPAADTPQQTTYTYYPTGLLNVVTLPDGTQLTYTYDDAHRLTDVVDGANNHVHYAYDSRSNRTGEQVSDSSGRLASSVSRVFDELNRVKSTTGAMH